MGEPLLNVRDLRVNYGAVQAIRGVSFDVRAGQIVTFIGANGAGKSTLLNSIIGLVKSHSGEVEFAGRRITNHEAHGIVNQGIALSPEGRRLFLNLTVRENLDLGGLVTNNAKRKQVLLEEVFNLFPRVKERLRQVAGTLSGGEQQMLAISRALMQDPKLLLLDEPSLGLAPNLVQEIFAKIRFLNGEGKTILLVEQNAFQALQVCHFGYVLEQGKVVLSGAGQKIIDDPKVQAAYLGG